MTQVPMSSPPGGAMRPHRGVMILVFGILSWFLCIAFGIASWIMGNNDLREMDAGRMDPEGRSLTQAGKIIGMIHVIVGIVSLVFALIGVVLFVIIGIGAAAASGTGGP